MLELNKADKTMLSTVEEGDHTIFINTDELYEWLFIDEIDSNQAEKEHYDKVDEIMVEEDVDFAGAKIFLLDNHERVLFLTEGKVAYLEIQ